jgi:hypothetical protein
MTVAKHNSGEWRVHGVGGYGALNGVSIKDSHGLTLAVAIGDVPELKAEENARLIAAAPELLEALQEFLSEYDGFQNGDGDPCPTLQRARAAIARATGDTPA